MTGPNIEHLRRTTQGMRSHDVETATAAWRAGASSIANVVGALSGLSPRTIKAFGDGATGDSAKSALERINKNLTARQSQMTDAADALAEVVAAMKAAEAKAAAIPDAPGPAPTRPSPLGTDADQAQQIKIYNSQKTSHDNQVASYNGFDSDAATKVKAVNDSYDKASAVLAKIHGDPDTGGTSTSGGTGTSLPGGSHSRGTSTVDGPVRIHHTTIGDPPSGWPGGGSGGSGGTGGTDGTGGGTGGGSTGGTGGGTDGPYGDPGLPGSDPGSGSDAGVDGTAGSAGFSPLAAGGGAIGAGVLGGFGLRGILAGRGVSAAGEGASTIGSSSRSSSSSVLGRGRPGGPGEAGSSGRGGAAGGAAGRRKGEDKDPGRGEGYDVDEDWTEDDGQFPGVIS